MSSAHQPATTTASSRTLLSTPPAPRSGRKKANALPTRSTGTRPHPYHLSCMIGRFSVGAGRATQPQKEAAEAQLRRQQLCGMLSWRAPDAAVTSFSASGGRAMVCGGRERFIGRHNTQLDRYRCVAWRPVGTWKAVPGGYTDQSPGTSRVTTAGRRLAVRSYGIQSKRAKALSLSASAMAALSQLCSALLPSRCRPCPTDPHAHGSLPYAMTAAW